MLTKMSEIFSYNHINDLLHNGFELPQVKV